MPFKVCLAYAYSKCPRLTRSQTHVHKYYIPFHSWIHRIIQVCSASRIHSEPSQEAPKRTGLIQQFPHRNGIYLAITHHIIRSKFTSVSRRFPEKSLLRIYTQFLLQRVRLLQEHPSRVQFSRCNRDGMDYANARRYNHVRKNRTRPKQVRIYKVKGHMRQNPASQSPASR